MRNSVRGIYESLRIPGHHCTRDYIEVRTLETHGRAGIYRTGHRSIESWASGGGSADPTARSKAMYFQLRLGANQAAIMVPQLKWQRMWSNLPTTFTRIMVVMLLGLTLSSPPTSVAAAAARRESDDVACLREFKDAVTDPLGYLRNWDFRGPRDIDICNFIGVTCVPDEPKVLKLDLTAAGLGGRISQDLFRKCSSLRELNLSNNFFTGRVPPTLCVHNRNLVTLDVSNNGFSGPLSPRLLGCLESHRQLFLDKQLHDQNGEISCNSREVLSNAACRDERIQ